jgi:hypothetical protein
MLPQLGQVVSRKTVKARHERQKQRLPYNLLFLRCL